MNIDDMPAGREMDALVAEVMELKVLGWGPAEPDPMGSPSADYAGYNVPYDGKAKEKHPVYLAHCACEFRDEEDAAILGHIAGCLEVVPFYSTHIAAAWGIVDHMAERSLTLYPLQRDRCRVMNFWTARFVTDDEPMGLPWEIGWSSDGSTAAEAICRAALKAVGVEDA